MNTFSLSVSCIVMVAFHLCDCGAIRKENDLDSKLGIAGKLRKINIDCIDKDEKFCGSYVANYGNRFCDQDWFISITGRYGCRQSCNLCDSATTCEDKDENYCATYVRVYGQRVCNYQWFISEDGRYGCKKSCDRC